MLQKVVSASILAIVPAVTFAMKTADFTPISLTGSACLKSLSSAGTPEQKVDYVLEEESFYNDEELRRLREIFDLGGHSMNRWGRRKVHSGRAIEVTNTVYHSVQFEDGDFNKSPWKFRESSLSNVSELNLSPDDLKLFYRMALRHLEVLRTDQPSLHSQLMGHPFGINFFGARYFLRRGQKLRGVHMHQHGDHVVSQGILLLNKPSDMCGGRFLLCPGNSKVKETVTHNSTSWIRRFVADKTGGWAIDLPINHFMIFDSLRYGHGTEAFRLPRDRQDEESIRDILGIEVTFEDINAAANSSGPQ